MQFALRQLSKGGPLVLLWVLVSGLCAISGPFGTQEGMGFAGRLIYWGTVVGGSILGSRLINHLSLQKRWQNIAAWTLFAMAIAGGVYAFDALFLGQNGRGSSFIYLFAIVGATVLVVHAMLWLAVQYVPRSGAPVDTALATAARFQRRLPLETRGPLVRIEAQDHYLNVITTKGSAMILMRLSEAVEELEDADGLQTHRSHWVSLDAVTSHRRADGRDSLMMSDGAEVPLARTRRDAAKAAGLF